MKWTLCLIPLLVCSAFGCRPIFRLYESRGYGDDYVENAVELVAVDDVWDIADHGFDHYFARTCPQGVWMGYEYAGFAGGNTLFYHYKYEGRDTGGVLRCRYENTGRYYQSLRIMGNPDDYTASALVTFMERWNDMTATTYLNDTLPIINTRFNSLLLMGNDEMELFTEENFNGASFCIGPNHGSLYNRREYDAVNELRNGTQLYTNLMELSLIFGVSEFKSFRFGCSQRNHSLANF